MGSVNYTILSGLVSGKPQDCNTASGFPTAKLWIDLVGKRKTKAGTAVGSSLVVPVYFYGDVARYVLSKVRADDLVIVEARLKRDGRGPKTGDPWLQLGGRSIKVIPSDGEPHEVVSQMFNDGPILSTYPIEGAETKDEE